MKKKHIILLILAVVVFIFLIIPIRIPSGCRKHHPWIHGGCFGKQLLKTFERKIPKECLFVDVNDCNMPSISIYNKCKEPLVIEGVSYKYRERYSVELEAGLFTIKGHLSNKPLVIRGYVTVPLCR